MTHRPIPVRHIRHHDRRLLKLHRANVTDDADDLLFLPWSPERQTRAPNRVLPRPEMLGHAFGNHDYVAPAIALIEDSAAQERNADGGEIIRARGAEIRWWRHVLAWWDIDSRYTCFPSEGQSAYPAGGPHAGQNADPAEERIVEMEPRPRVGVALRRQVNVRSQNIFGCEPRVDAQQAK